MKRLQSTLLLLLLTGVFIQAQSGTDIRVHDPVMIRQDSVYYLFCTGRGIAVWSSKDMKNWERLEPIFPEPPEWVPQVVADFKNHIWAPDISYHNGQYYLYYSISAFGKNTSAIGVVTNKTLHPGDPDFGWTDHGIVVQSVPNRDLWNAIDPNLALDEDGTPWLSFGSFWEGLKMVQLTDDLLSIKQPEEWHTIAKRKRSDFLDDDDPGDGAIEAPFIFKKNDYYYLFASYDYCCRGENSTYKVRVGRAEKLVGPYLDNEGTPMNKDGGTLVVQGNKRYAGAGHNSIYTFDGKDYLIFHAYDMQDQGKPKLKIVEVKWDEGGWPEGEF